MGDSENKVDGKSKKKSEHNSDLSTKMIHHETFDRINKWRKTQQKKKSEEESEKIRKKIFRKEMARREILRKKQIEEKKKAQHRIKTEAKKLKMLHETKRKLIETKLNLHEKINLEKKKAKSKSVITTNGEKLADEKDSKVQELDPLDAFMIELEAKNKKRTKKRANTKLSKNLSKQITKIIPKTKTSRYQKVEIFENESLYEEKDLVIREETSWLDKMKGKKKEVKEINHDKMDYLPFRKDFYIESPEIKAMTNEEVEIYRKEELEGVNIRGKDCPRPIRKWSQCGLPGKIYTVLEHYSYSEPFPIQCQAIPCIMAGRDIIACAKTGSGKTLAFIIPMFRHLLDQPPLETDEGPISLIISPTRELAKQIFFETKKFAIPLGLRVVCCHGGATVADQIADLRRGAEIIVATPGRMIDMLSANGGRVTNSRRVTYLVLDEADRMFDMGFEPQLSTILNTIRPDRQTVLFSATFPRQVEGLVKQIMKRPVEIVIGGRSVASNSVIQSVKIVEEYEKFNVLLKILGENYNKGQILIFTDRQEAVDSLFTDLQRAGYFTLTLHGGMDQNDRDSMIQDFKNKTRTILIATSVAARGLDIKDLNLVVNYTVPNHYEDYVHRVGRTGRAGKTGYAITFITPSESKYAADLYKALKLAKQKNIPHKLEKMAEEFRQKVEKGEEKSAPTMRSSGSKGYRFDETEEYTHKMQRQREEAVYGGSAAKGSEAEALEKQKEAAKETEKEKEPQTKTDKLSNLLDRQLAAAKAGAAAIRTTINATKQTHSNEESNAMAHIAYKSVYNDAQTISASSNTKRGRAEAIAKTLTLSQKLSALGSNATPQRLAEAINQRSHIKRFVINDYPQRARFKVSSRATTESVKEFSDVDITVHGTFFAPGRKPGMGEEKLTLVIEGKTAVHAERAYADLKRIAEETAKECGPSGSAYGKYSVV